MNPQNVTCDYIPQQNLTIPNILMKRSTDGIIHTHYFNGSIVEYNHHYLMAYRSDQEPFCTHPRIHIVELTNRMIPLPDTNKTIEVKSTKQCWRVDYAGRCHKAYQHRAEDPRLCVVGDTLYLIWGDGFKIYYSALVCSFTEVDGMQRLASVVLMAQHIPKPPYVEELHNDPRYDGREKNWIPFRYNGKLHVIYSYEPFVTMRLDGRNCYDVVKHEKPLNWKWGFIKGGTPAIPYNDDSYVTFFHSTVSLNYNYYYVGALVFSKEDLRPLSISRYPIIAPYPENEGNQIIFPAGVIDKGDHYLISYGYNDECNKILAYPKDQLVYNMRDIEEMNIQVKGNVLEQLHLQVVNLDRSPDRLESMEKQLGKYSIPWSRFPAVDGRHFPDGNNTCRLSYKWKEMSNGQRGCALSHVSLLRKMINENWDYMMVMEDDVILCEDFKNTFNYYWQNQTQKDMNFDVLYVGNQNVPDRDGVGVINKPTFCTHGLIWSQKGARKMLSLIERDGLYVIDIMMIEAHTRGDLRAYSWIRRLTEKELSMNLYHERSSGLVFQSREFEGTIHG